MAGIFSRSKDPKNGGEITIKDIRSFEVPEFESELLTLELPNFKVIYYITFDEGDITKEEEFYSTFDLVKIPVVGDYVSFGESGDCTFKVQQVVRSQDEDEIRVYCDYVGHDSGLVKMKMRINYGFE